MNLKPYSKLLRVKNWRAFFLTTTLGFVISKGYFFPMKDIVVFYIMTFMLLGFGFTINDCFDTEEDSLNKEKENSIVNGEVSFKKGLVFSISLAFLGLILSLSFGINAFLICFLSILMVFFYSVPPVRLKSRFILDLISHGLFGGAFLFFIPIVIFSEKIVLSHYIIGFSIFCFSMILELRNHLEDHESDKKAGLKTTVCVLGVDQSETLLKYLLIFYPLTFLPIFLLNDWNNFRLFTVLTAIFLYLFLSDNQRKIVKNYRVADIYAISSLILVWTG